MNEKVFTSIHCESVMIPTTYMISASSSLLLFGLNKRAKGAPSMILPVQNKTKALYFQNFKFFSRKQEHIIDCYFYI